MVGPINFTWTTSRSLGDVRNWVSTSVVSVLRKAGYRVKSDTPEELVMTHRASSSWPMLLFSWVAFWLSQRRSCQVVFTFLRTPEGKTQMVVIGQLPTRISRILYQLPNG